MNRIHFPSDWDEAEGDDLIGATENRWRSFADRLADNCRGYLLVDATTERVDTLQILCRTANYLADHLELEPLYLADPCPEKERLCRAYFPGDFVSTNSSAYGVGTYVGALSDLYKSFKTIDDVQDFLDLVVRDVPIGDLIYNSSLMNSGEGTFDEVGEYLYRRLVSAHLLFRHSERIVTDYDVDAVLGRHIFYERNGIPYRVGMRTGAPLLNFKPSIGLLRRYDSLSEAKVDFPRPSESLFNCVYNDHRRLAISEGARTMADRIGLEPVLEGEADVTPHSRPPVLRNGLMSMSNPTILILPHIFVENLRFDRGIFRDYLTWFRKTLRFAERTENINWLVKPHPNRELFDQKQDVGDEVERIAGDVDARIRLLPDEVEHADLIPEVDAVVTIDGTAGIEYSCFGIPTILAGKSSYSGFGFTIEPEDDAAYFEQLRNPSAIPPLSRDQRDRALVMAYIHFRLLRNNGPSYPQDRSSAWSNALAFVRGPSPEDDPYYHALGEYVAREDRHLVRSSEIDC